MFLIFLLLRGVGAPDSSQRQTEVEVDFHHKVYTYIITKKVKDAGGFQGFVGGGHSDASTASASSLPLPIIVIL